MTGPRRRQQLVGPINENKTAMHHCFTDFILAHLEKSAYQVDLDDEVASLSAEEQEQIWRREYPHPCRTTCPGSASQPLMWHEADGLSDDHDHDIANSTPLGIAQGLSRSRPTTRSSTTTLSPLFGNLDVGPALIDIIQDPPSPALAAFGSSPPLALPTDPVEETGNIDYRPLEAPYFLNFQMVENHINQSRIPDILEIDEPFSITAGSVSAAAEGFVNALKGVKQDPYAKFNPYRTAEVPERDTDFYSIEPAEVTLSTMFSWGSWIFKA